MLSSAASSSLSASERFLRVVRDAVVVAFDLEVPLMAAMLVIKRRPAVFKLV